MSGERALSGLRLNITRGRVVKSLTAGACAALAAVPLAAGAQTGGVPNTYPSALSPTQIAQLANNATERVIVVLRNQHPEVPGRPGAMSSRAATVSSDQSPIVNELQTLHAPAVHSYSLINAVSATVSAAEAARLASNPAVSEVIPDVQRPGPSRAVSAAAAAGAVGGHVASNSASASSTSNAPASSQEVCPSNPAQPILEPEALQLMNVDFGPGSSLPAAHDYATGTGVKIAVFPDGLDPNIPDFIRGGSSAIFDYQDFSGEGTGAVTGGGEAFGDASSLIAQGTHTYDLSGHVNPAHPLPPGCNIRIEGVAPGASVAVMKVFGNSNLAFNSLILQGIDYAVSHDGVDILSQSFGGNPIPNPGNDAIALVDSAAVAAGVTVVVSSGDAGTTNTIGSPSDAPGVISAGATTSYRLYAQTTSYGYQFGTGGWVSNNVSAFSSSGDTEYGPQTINVVAPGESGWADCSTNTAVFTQCADIYHGASPQPIESFGGTSQSCPFTAGTAALVIQAYRDTHGGATPSPALVKQIIMSTAQDLHIPAQNQGAGLVDALRAVQLARSIQDTHGTPAAVGSTLQISPNSVSDTASPGHDENVPVTVTNRGTTSETITPQVRVLGAAVPITAGTLSLNSSTDPTFIYQSGATVGDVHLVTFNVPAGVDRLVERIAWSTATNPGSTIRLSVFNPAGQMTSQSRPQGAGGGFGEIEVHNPAAGAWTFLIFSTGAPYTGPLTYSITGASFHNSNDAVEPGSHTVAPGATATFHVHVKTPSAPGDLAEAVTFSVPGGGVPQATIPVTLRAMVPLNHSGGSFNGTLTGGNARMAFYGQELTYQFVVPANRDDLNVDVTVSAPGYQVFGFLVDPNVSPVDVQSTIAFDGSANGQTMHFSWANPTPGRWTLDLAQINGISSVLTSASISGRITFDTVNVSSSGLPHSAHTKLTSGQARTATVHVVNTGNQAAAYSVDPRLDSTSALSLASLAPTSGTLPISNFAFAQFVVPPYTTNLVVAAASNVPINFDTSPGFGYPDVASTSFGNQAVVDIVANDIAASTWACAPTEIGPYATTAPSEPWSCGAFAATNTFDSTVTSSTGNIWSALEGLTTSYSPLVLQPGQSGDITVTITPTGSSGTEVSGFLGIETFNFNTNSSDQQIRLPYDYTIR